ncbi:MAG: Bug family tripartite tricarboxylate transporter substrate binding protein [Pseudomonadales bacterium]
MFDHRQEVSQLLQRHAQGRFLSVIAIFGIALTVCAPHPHDTAGSQTKIHKFIGEIAMSAIGRSIKALCVLSAVFALVAAARAEEVKIPSTIKLIVGYPPGGSVDTVARLIAQPLSKELGTTVVVDNRPGAGGRIAAGIVHNSPADGSVMMLAPNALTTVQTLVYEGKLGYDMLKDFQPVSRIASYPFALSVSAQSGIQSPSDLPFCRSYVWKGSIG